MNDALCDMTWSGPQKKNYQMGYICEIEYDAKDARYRRDTDESSCQVEYRTRRGILENIQMSCKESGDHMNSLDIRNNSKVTRTYFLLHLSN